MATPTVTPGPGEITVMCMGRTDSNVLIVINQGTTQVVNQTKTLDGSGNGKFTFNLPAGTYDVKVTIPAVNGTVFDFPNQVVT